MGTFLIQNFPYLIIAVFIILLICLGRDVKSEMTDGGDKEWHLKKRPLFKSFIHMIREQLKKEGIEVSKDFVTEVISFCILGGVNPQKIRFKEGKFTEYWIWEQQHRGVMREAHIEEPEKVVSRILELAHDIGQEYDYNIRREYSAFVRLKYMRHVPDIWWFADIFEKYM